MTGELSVLVKRPDVTVPGLGLTEVIGAPFVFSSEKPGGKDTIVVRIGQLDSEIQDAGEAAAPVDQHQPQGDGDSARAGRKRCIAEPLWRRN